MLYEKPKRLGRGAEGTVYRIGRNLVKKVWYDTAWCNYGVEDIVQRIIQVQKQCDALPEKIKNEVKVPEFAGYEKRGHYVVTYHEYIKKEKMSLNKWYDGEIYKELDQRFKDLQLNYNTLYSKGKFYLVDVGIRE